VKVATASLLLAALCSLFGWQAASAPRAEQTSGPAPAAPPVPYPEGYREWAHVKSSLISPAHETYAVSGGFQHTYANAAAMQGYRTRNFPEGSVIVVDWLEMRDMDGTFVEGARRRIDVMVKDSLRYAATGGWGFQRFAGDSKTELAQSPTPQQCFACHNSLKKDGLVLGTYRP